MVGVSLTVPPNDKNPKREVEVHLFFLPLTADPLPWNAGVKQVSFLIAGDSSLGYIPGVVTFTLCTLAGHHYRKPSILRQASIQPLVQPCAKVDSGYPPPVLTMYQPGGSFADFNFGVLEFS